MPYPHNVRRRKWLSLYLRRKRKCFACGREPFTQIGRLWRCYFHRNP